MSTTLVRNRVLYSVERMFTPRSAHIGGFTMGLLTGTILYPIISTTKVHRTVTWSFRIAAIPLAVVLYVVLIRNFYTSNPYAGMTFWNFAISELAKPIRSMLWLPLLVLFPNSRKQPLSRVRHSDSVHVHNIDILRLT